MFVNRILYDDDFVKDLLALSQKDQQHAVKAQELFSYNPLHPSLRLHQLHGSLEGLWSLSITRKIRLIFQRENSGDIIFLSIGHHDIYKNL